jgi:sugar lactone lactonase YvrE
MQIAGQSASNLREALMKSTAILFLGLFIALACFKTAEAQLLNHPESVVYDSIRNRYLVSNWDSGDMIQIDSNGVQDYFVIGQHCYAGLHIIDDIIYVAGRNQGVRGFDLETGQMVMQVAIPGSGVLNDVTSDDSGNLYISDPNVHRIYKININTGNWSTFVSSGLSSPNGLYFDSAHNRLLLVSSRSFSPLQAVSLHDSTVTTIVYTGISILDGLTMDEYGNVYFSSWNTHSVYKYDSTFTNPPEQISVHSPEPADIYYNPLNDVIAVPIFYGNYIDFVEISPTSVVSSQVPEIPQISVRMFPNPFNNAAQIDYQLASPSFVRIGIFDLLGREIDVIQNDFLPAGRQRAIWDAANRASGIYFCRIETDNYTISQKMTLSK